MCKDETNHDLLIWKSQLDTYIEHKKIFCFRVMK